MTQVAGGPGLPVNGGLECGGDREEFLACTLQECVGKWQG